LWTDAAAVKNKSLDRRVALRAWRVVKPFRWWIAAFLVTIVIDAVLALLPPLLFRSIVDHAIPQGNRGLVWLLASFIVGVALVDAVLAIVQRWFSAHIGEGVIHHLRVQLFDRVQHQSIAFFTRSQTGALISG
jgi:ATP-binding cassette subfamily B protein